MPVHLFRATCPDLIFLYPHKLLVKCVESILNENKEVAKLLRQIFSVRKVMKLTDKSSGLVQKVKKLLSLFGMLHVWVN